MVERPEEALRRQVLPLLHRRPAEADFIAATSGRFSGVGLTVTEVPKGLRVAERAPRHPGREGRARAGRPDRRRRRQVDRRGPLRRLDRADQGTRGDRGRAAHRARRRRRAPRTSTLERADVRVPAVEGGDAARRRRRQDRLRPASAPSARAPTASFATRSSASTARAPRAWCSTCAATAAGCSTRRCCARASSSSTATSSRPAAAPRATRTTRRSATRSTRARRSVLVDRDTASAAEILTAALQQNDLADGRRHAHLRQGHLPGGHRPDPRRRARPDDRRVPDRGRHVDPRRGRQAQRPGRRRPRRPRRTTRRSTGRSRSSASSCRPRAIEPLRRRRRPPRALPRRRAAVRARRRAGRGSAGGVRVRGGRDGAVHRAHGARGERGRRARRSRRGPRRRRGADLGALAASAGSRAGSRTTAARSPPPSAVEPIGAPRPDRARHVHRRPGHRARLRRRGLRLEPTATAIRLWIHIADVAAHVRPGTRLDDEAARRGEQRLRPGDGRADAARWRSRPTPAASAPGVDRLAVTAEILLGADGEPRSASFYRSRIRSDARLSYDQLDEFFAGARAPPEPDRRAARRSPAARRRRCATAAGGSALEVSTTEPEFEFDCRRRRGRAPTGRADRGARADRAADDLRQRAGRRALRAHAGCRPLYRVHERPDPTRVAALVDEARGARHPDAAAAQGDPISPAQAAELVAEASRLVAAEAERRGHGRAAYTSLVLALLEAGHVLRPQPRPRRPRQPRLLPISPRRSAATRTWSPTGRCSPRSAPARRA